ncbi:MAG: MauE/DoxX family redox-associated membrane protein [Myxococcota bacterium]
MERLALDPALWLILHGAASLLFFSAAAHKLRDPVRFRVALADHRLLPRAALPAVAFLFASCELAVALGCLLPGVCPFAAMGGAALLCLYSGAVGINLARGRSELDCGCGGPAGGMRIGPGLLLRNLGLIVLLGFAALPMGGRALHPLDGVTVVSGVGVLALLYTALETALANGSRTRRRLAWSRR